MVGWLKSVKRGARTTHSECVCCKAAVSQCIRFPLHASRFASQFSARPRTKEDGSTDLLTWDVVIPGMKIFVSCFCLSSKVTDVVERQSRHEFCWRRVSDNSFFLRGRACLYGSSFFCDTHACPCVVQRYLIIILVPFETSESNVSDISLAARLLYSFMVSR